MSVLKTIKSAQREECGSTLCAPSLHDFNSQSELTKSCLKLFGADLNQYLDLDHQFHDLTTIQLRYQSFDIRHEDEPGVGTLIAEIWS